MKKHKGKDGEKQVVDGEHEFQLEQPLMKVLLHEMEFLVDNDYRNLFKQEDLSLSRPPSSRGDYNIMLEKRKYTSSSEKNIRILKSSQSSVSQENTSTISVSPPAKKKSPQKPEIPTWDVPQTITVRRSRAGSTAGQLLDEKIGDNVSNKNMKEKGDDNSGMKNVLAKDVCSAVSQLEAEVVQSSNLQQSIANTVSDTDRLEQFARML
ncbi:unnamed protein product [Onchocerca flexuosa]|uniref:Methyl-CpG-binding domain protein n=1 Tax=Onchocerca flexuosa TaxID=387005 RepID=A0A183I760_9BILA|nr:unnamed protein product [Onchocerca flexuosa]